MNFYGIKDNLVNKFTFYLHAQNDNELRRLLSDVLQDPNHQITRHYKDYSVYFISGYDESSNLIIYDDSCDSTFSRDLTPVRIFDIFEIIPTYSDNSKDKASSKKRGSK